MPVLERAITATNASKVALAILLNAAIDFTEQFGLYDLSDGQESALSGILNAALLAYFLLTYKRSHKRV